MSLARSSTPRFVLLSLTRLPVRWPCRDDSFQIRLNPDLGPLLYFIDRALLELPAPPETCAFNTDLDARFTRAATLDSQLFATFLWVCKDGKDDPTSYTGSLFAYSTRMVRTASQLCNRRN